MEDTLLVHPTAQGLYEVFEKMPSTVRKEFKAMIRLPKRTKKNMQMIRNIYQEMKQAV